MPKKSSIYVCQQCGYRSPTFMGRCPECGTWNSLVEEVIESPTSQSSKAKTKKIEIVNLKDVVKKDYQRTDTKLSELNRVLGGGIVLGSVVLVAGDPGIGKSTLLSQLSLNVPNTLYVAGEESAQQIKIRIDRIKPNSDLKILNETDVDTIAEAISQNQPQLVIVDSIQTLETSDLNSAAGSVGQVRESAHRLHAVAKKLHVPIFIVGHVTKEGSVAGPKTLEHLVDVVLSLEGESNGPFRVLRATKNRFGATDEVGLFEMRETGMIEVKNPSSLFIEQKVQAPGSVAVVVVNGIRPWMLEIQALVSKSYAPIPRRVANGIDNNRLQLLVAVLAKKLNLPLSDQDVFVNVTGGIRVTETAADLGICLAIISSLKNQTLAEDTAIIGEVGLLGEIREVTQLDKRIKEAQNLGFKNIISPLKAKTLVEASKFLK